MSKEDKRMLESRLQSIDRTLQEIRLWTRFANISKLKETLEKELDTDEKKIAYENSNGVKRLEEVARACGSPKRTVGNWWQKWFRLGLATESETRKGRMKKIVSLDDIGIRISRRMAPKPATQVTPTQQDEPKQTTSKERDESS